MAQKIISIGNSLGLSIPSETLKKMGLKKGNEVVLEISPDKQALIIMDAKKVEYKANSPVSQDFNEWLDKFMDENGEILDELADK